MILVTDKYVSKNLTFCAVIGKRIPLHFMNVGDIYNDFQEVWIALKCHISKGVTLDFLVDNQDLHAYLFRHIQKSGVKLIGTEPTALDWDPSIIALALGVHYEADLIPTSYCPIEGTNENPVLNNMLRLSGTNAFNLIFSDSTLTDIEIPLFYEYFNPEIAKTLLFPKSAIETVSALPQSLKNNRLNRNQMWTMEYTQSEINYPKNIVWPNEDEFLKHKLYGFLARDTIVAYIAIKKDVLTNIQVLPSFRGQTLGKSLVGLAVSKGVRKLQCRESLIPWYQSLGFKTCAKSKGLFTQMRLK